MEEQVVVVNGVHATMGEKAFDMLPEVTTWKLETILQEPANCHLYEKCGFVRIGEDKVINENMTLIDYELKK